MVSVLHQLSCWQADSHAEVQVDQLSLESVHTQQAACLMLHDLDQLARGFLFLLLLLLLLLSNLFVLYFAMLSCLKVCNPDSQVKIIHSSSIIT